MLGNEEKLPGYERLSYLASDAYGMGDDQFFSKLFEKTGLSNVDDLGYGFFRFGSGPQSKKRLFQALEARKASAALRRNDHVLLNEIARNALRDGNKKVFEVIFCAPGYNHNVNNLGEGFAQFGAGMESWDKLFMALREKYGTDHEKYATYKAKLMAAKAACEASQAGDYDHLNELLQHALTEKNKKVFDVVLTLGGWGNVNDFGEGFFKFESGPTSVDKLYAVLNNDTTRLGEEGHEFDAWEK